MKNKKGITLIALVITIIVMMILVGVSVSIVINTGLFKTASGTSKNMEEYKMEELDRANGMVNIAGHDTSINEYVAELNRNGRRNSNINDRRYNKIYSGTGTKI